MRRGGARRRRGQERVRDGRTGRTDRRRHDTRAGADERAVSLAWISVGALVLAVALSCTTTINVGILSLSLALLVGVYLGGMTADAVLTGFPTSLLVTLIGVTLLFSIADCNGTLARLTAR